MLPNKDGRVIRFAKEIQAPEVVDQLVGENLIATMSSMNLQTPEKVVLLNDTVATLLAGVNYQNRMFDSYIGFIKMNWKTLTVFSTHINNSRRN